MNLFQDALSSTINLDQEPFLIYINDVFKILCRVLLKNFGIFAKLHYHQVTNLFRNSKSLYMVTDAGDVYQYLRSKFTSPKNTTVEYVLKDDEFESICLSFIQQIRDYPKINGCVSKYPDDFDKIWEVCKFLILPVRVNSQSIPRNEKERILRLWMSVSFCIPMLEIYNNKYLPYGANVQALRTLPKIILTNDDKKLNFEVIKRLQASDNLIIETFVSPTAADNKTNKIFKTYMFILVCVSIEIINKSCPNLTECKAINPNYDGQWIYVFDDYVGQQIKKIQNAANAFSPK